MKENLRLALISRQITEAIDQGQLDSASVQARTLGQPSQQIPLVIQIADAHTKRKELESALLCLTEAEQLLDELVVTSRLRFRVEIVEKTAKLDSERAYRSAARLVEEINRAGSGKSGPIALREGPDLAVASDLLRSNGFGLLADADFDATLALAQSIARPETSIAAQLAVCRSRAGRKLRALKSSPCCSTNPISAH